ncbi:MAG: hypothetical protein IKR73_07180 [Oscillospiraceae bacterium]|nr:hypothetical protein [Oscillospiraceae bacterium]
MKLRATAVILACAAVMSSAAAAGAEVIYYDSYDQGYYDGNYYNDTNYNNSSVYYDTYNYDYSTPVNTAPGYVYDPYTGQYTTRHYYNYTPTTVYNSYNNKKKYNNVSFSNADKTTANTIVSKKKTSTATTSSLYTDSSLYYGSVSVLSEFPYVKHTTVNRRIDQYKYYDNTRSIVFRRASGNRDISGVTTRYGVVKSIKIDRSTVKIKGNRNGYYLAIWTRNGYAYSIKSSYALSLGEMESLVLDVMNGYVY